ncbi:uncharacterized protein LOC132196045 [Neocloeon triangulifer]|uniref:uncharacterized protein LOC132196045 n=1 Tax=Neocloeon triangulifer TaxID=2078957 RepID=UPI00286F29E4|nr:uncharacterized protein LOC132196045 [Neocloeon triangulifer]
MRLHSIPFLLFLVFSTEALPFLPMIVKELAKREAPVQSVESGVIPPMNDNPRAEGGIVPGMPSMPGFGGGESGGGSGSGMMFNQPMAMMGGFTMLMMPAQDAMAMAQNFQQFASSMSQMPIIG